MEKFCPKCGKKIVGGVLCADCEQDYLQYTPINVKLCPSKKYFHKGTWNGFRDLKSLSSKLVKQNVKVPVRLISGLEAYPGLLEKPGLKKQLILEVESGLEVYPLPISVEITYSPGMAKAGSKYFEGILQLRNVSEQSKAYIRKYLLRKSKKEVIVSKVVENSKGIDYYFTQKKKMRPLALKLIRNFGGYISENPQLFSKDRQTSKDIYRQNILVELPPFTEKDVVVVTGTPIRVLNTEKIITGINLLTGKKTTFTYDEKSKNNILLVKKKRTTISQVHPELMVLHPETYQPVKAENPLKLGLTPGQNVRVITHKNKHFLLP